jgi:hypothetical protein
MANYSSILVTHQQFAKQIGVSIGLVGFDMTRNTSQWHWTV